MTRRKTPGTSKSTLSQEDTALWDHAAQSVEPLRAKPRVPGSTHVGEAATFAPTPRHGHAETRSAPPSPKPRHELPRTSAHRPPPHLADFDRKKAKKLAAGREEIHARIDLHGMRQSQAHAALRAFLLACHADGRRNVLVITGKGGPPREEEPGLIGYLDTNERGILKRNVPLWLAEPELRAIVVSYRAAAQLHGGTGALYVHLRAHHKTGRR